MKRIEFWRRGQVGERFLASLTYSNNVLMDHHSPDFRGSRWWVAALLTAVFIVFLPPAMGADLDRVLVIVDDGVITQSDLEFRVVQHVVDLQSTGQSIPAKDELERQVVRELVQDQVLLHRAQAQGIRVDEALVDNAVVSMAKRNRLSSDGLRREVERRGMPFTRYREGLREQLLIRELVSSEVTRYIEVSDVEIDEFLSSQKKPAVNHEAQLDLSHILISVPAAVSVAERETRESLAIDILHRVESGMPFDEAARQFSQGPHASKGGNLGLLPVSQLPELLVAAVEGLAPGDLSSVVESAGGFHIVRLNVRAQAGQQLVRQYRVRHILRAPNAVSNLSIVRARLIQVRDRILAGADFSTMVRLHSEHLPSRSSGGDLGWVGPGDVVPEFEAVLKELVPGQVSLPSQTRFGLHLIEVTDERLHDVAGKRLRAQARSAIRSRKIDERYEEWLNELIDRAFIEYRSPRFQAQ